MRSAPRPFAFLRGGAAIMAEDFARLPATGITPVISLMVLATWAALPTSVWMRM